LKRKGFLFFIIAVIAIMVLTLTACTASLATINGYKITQVEIDKYLSSAKIQNPDLFKPENKNELLKAEAQIIDYIIANKLINKYAGENKISYTEQEFTAEYTKLQTTNFKTNEEFLKYLTDNSISEDLLKTQVRNQLLAQKVFEKVTAGITVSDAEVSKYYEDNKGTAFANPEQIKISHILVQYGDQDTAKKTKEAALEKINMIAQKLKDGETFENMANKYSEDANSNTLGGDIGYFSKGQLVAEFEKAAFALEVGQVSGIVETTYGFHIIKVTDKKAASIKTFAEVKDSIKSYLESNLKNDKFNAFLLKLKDAAVIKYSKDIENINNAATSTTSGGSSTTGSATQSTSGADTTNGQSTTTQEQLVTTSTK
jgi:foldase protein PrsA